MRGSREGPARVGVLPSLTLGFRWIFALETDKRELLGEVAPNVEVYSSVVFHFAPFTPPPSATHHGGNGYVTERRIKPVGRRAD